VTPLDSRRSRSRHTAQGLPLRVKPILMDALPWPVWKRVVYPVWLRWYERWCDNANIWKYGSFKAGDRVRWRGVRLVCCTDHYVGDAAEHPWDPGWGWAAWKANVLWEPATARDRLLLRLVGDPRRAK
jgi:hypothetical protein